MNAFSRFEELLDEQGYSLRAAVAQVNKESKQETVVFNNQVATFDESGDSLIDSSDEMVFFMNHKCYP